MKSKFLPLSLAFALCGQIAFSQTDTTAYDLSIEELMNIEIVSASKKTENLFDASLSASVITRDEIRNAGATSIMEALRLVPGVIVREQANGNYDIHVRGLDNVPPNSLVLTSTNTTTLVMINNRPVYNYLQGGTFWESLPIDLNDVEKIEVVRGPSSTLYGPNAVSGVINIITRKLENEGFSYRGNAQYGSLNTIVANSTIGYKVNDNLDVSVSGNFQSRERSESRMLNLLTYEWVNSPGELQIDNANERFPNPEISMSKYGVNAFINYAAQENAQFSLATGLQDSEIQGVGFDNSVVNRSTTTTNSRYVDFQASTYGLNTQIAYTSAVQSPALGMMGAKYAYQVMDASAEYDIAIGTLSIKPGITYRNAVYNDSKYWDIANGEGTIRGERIMSTFGGSIRMDYKLLDDKMRLTGGIRLDKFTYPDKWFTSYQAAASYKINEKNLVRAVYSRAYRSPFILDTYLDYDLHSPAGPGIFTEISVTGNKIPKLLFSDMTEIGYRSMLLKNLSLDVEAYFTKTSNYSGLIRGATQPTPANYPIVAVTAMNMENIPLDVEQMGATFSFTWVVDKFQIKPFMTLQKTTLKNYSPYFSTSDAAATATNHFDAATYNVDSGVGTEKDHEFTPKAYGGAHINYRMGAKFNLNMNTYWFSKQTFYQSDNVTYNDGIRGVERIDGKAIVNAKIGYTPVTGVSIFVTGKNLLATKSVEYYQGDVTPMMVLGGVSLDF